MKNKEAQSCLGATKKALHKNQYDKVKTWGKKIKEINLKEFKTRQWVLKVRDVNEKSWYMNVKDYKKMHQRRRIETI